MQDLLSMISHLDRPKILVQAARFGVNDYRRGKHLTRLLQCGSAPRPGNAVIQLMEREHDMNALRVCSAPDYSIAGHIELLIALLGEARMLRAALPPLQLV
ncbi:MAG: hypothetical protein JKX69_09205 [Rhodobacteraceae bacterium]|nr:hypothetical protein [Paracoccaceae bacterium]